MKVLLAVYMGKLAFAEIEGERFRFGGYEERRLVWSPHWHRYPCADLVPVCEIEIPKTLQEG